MDALHGFLLGSAVSDAGTIGRLDGESRARYQKIVHLQCNVNGLVAVRDALAKALAEVAPDHPLANKDNRNKIYDEHCRIK